MSAAAGLLLALIAFLLAALLGSGGGGGQKTVSSRPLPAPKTRPPQPPLPGVVDHPPADCPPLHPGHPDPTTTRRTR